VVWKEVFENGVIMKIEKVVNVWKEKMELEIEEVKEKGYKDIIY
jgi:hypothetical protein